MWWNPGRLDYTKHPAKGEKEEQRERGSKSEAEKAKPKVDH